MRVEYSFQVNQNEETKADLLLIVAVYLFQKSINAQNVTIMSENIFTFHAEIDVHAKNTLHIT